LKKRKVPETQEEGSGQELGQRDAADAEDRRHDGKWLSRDESRKPSRPTGVRTVHDASLHEGQNERLSDSCSFQWQWKWRKRLFH
jgi:hypothetical protein